MLVVARQVADGMALTVKTNLIFVRSFRVERCPADACHVYIATQFEVNGLSAFRECILHIA